jgi:AcrR family transcriptional regulator
MAGAERNVAISKPVVNSVDTTACAAIDARRCRVTPSRPVTAIPQARPERAAPLTREALIAATIRIADAEGASAVTMRRLGAELGVDATAFYRHFRDKDELLQAAADWLIAGALQGFEPSGVWARDLRELVLGVRRRYLEHPGLVVLVATSSGPLQSEALATERVLAVIRSGGFDREEAARAFEVLQDYLISLTVADAAAIHESIEPWRQAFANLDADAFPNLAASADLLYLDREARFRFGLDLLIEALDRRRA